MNEFTHAGHRVKVAQADGGWVWFVTAPSGAFGMGAAHTADDARRAAMAEAEAVA
jgi:hypothetical protein